MAAALPALAIGLVAVGGLMSASSAVRQGNAAGDSAEYNASISRRNAQIALDQSNRDAEAQGRSARKQIGQMRANYGASGVRLEGSPLDVLEESMVTAELDRQNILYRGRLRAIGYSEEANLDEARADNARQAGYETGAAALIGSGARAFGMSGYGFGGGNTIRPYDGGSAP